MPLRATISAPTPTHKLLAWSEVCANPGKYAIDRSANGAFLNGPSPVYVVFGPVDNPSESSPRNVLVIDSDGTVRPPRAGGLWAYNNKVYYRLPDDFPIGL